MKFKEYTIPVEDIVDEAPMGMIKTGLTKLASKVPGSIGAKAAGSLQTGQNANAMYKEFWNYLGQTGQKPTTASVSAFLKSKGVNDAVIKKHVVAPQGSTAKYPQGGAEQGAAPAQQPAAAPQAPAAPAAQGQAATPQQAPADKPKRQRDYKKEREQAAANKAAKSAAAQPAPATPTPAAPAPAQAPEQGFRVDKKTLDKQRGQNELMRAARNIQTGRTDESIKLQKLLSKISKRL